MTNYYSERLNSDKLMRCYQIAPKRIQQFLEAEIEFVLQNVKPTDKVLDLGCGYGRVSFRLADHAEQVTGIDISMDNIRLARELDKEGRVRFYEMNAIDLSFDDGQFDMTICVQNGISAFKVDPEKLVKEALRVTKKSGKVLLSSYSDKFWEDRLAWFQLQAENGILGEIDYDLTKNGTIICKDGFKAITYSAKEFLRLASDFDVEGRIYEIDGSSVFCEMIKL